MALSDVILAAKLSNLAELYKEEGRYADACGRAGQQLRATSRCPLLAQSRHRDTLNQCFWG